MMMSLDSLKLLRATSLVLLLHVESSMHVLTSRATDSNAQCKEKERLALLEFKRGLIDDYGRLSSWGNQDGNTNCCKWNGVQCNSQTGHVEILDLHGDRGMVLWHPMRGKISSSLMNLQHLNYLNLSLNDFEDIHIPEFFGSLSKLRYLDLSTASFGGSIPYQLGKLSSLQYLDLKSNNLIGVIPYQLGNLSNLQTLQLQLNDNLRIDENSAYAPWISNVSSLTELGFGGINLHNSKNWLQMIGRLPRITKLGLRICNLSDVDFCWLSSQLNSSTSLTALDLSFNKLTSWIFPRLFNLCSNLSMLLLSSNSLEGRIPYDFGNKMSRLEFLDLSDNKINGTIPESFGLLSELWYLNLRMKFLDGEITNIHFANLTKLKVLILYSNLTLKFNNSWIPPFQLEVLILGSCKVGHAFPKWLLTQKNLSILYMIDAGISDAILESLLCGDGSVSNSLESLAFLDLSNNQLSGQLPTCQSYLKSLVFLDLSNNQLSGNIPTSMGSLLEIQSLNFRNNNLTGELPSLKNYTKLVLLDAGENELSGPLPSWIGNSMQSLERLTLRKNRFNGSLPLHICHLRSIQLLDLSLNNLSGQIPRCLNNFSAMAKTFEFNETMQVWFTQKYKDGYIPFYVSYKFYPYLVWKGKELLFTNSRRGLKTFDLSSNQLSGEIPAEIGNLVELVSLNLSKNNLSGEIPPELGNLRSLDSLDLSRNHIFGRIPDKFSQIDRLGVLDLSNNNLSGKIPIGTQLQGFNASIYGGNPFLCGSPLEKPCLDGTTEDEPIENRKEDEEEEEEEENSLLSQGFYASLGIGFVTGFWGIFGSLMIIRSWRHAYVHFLNNLSDNIYVMATLNLRRCYKWCKKYM